MARLVQFSRMFWRFLPLALVSPSQGQVPTMNWLLVGHLT
jgi:hypothetical protein